MSPVPIGLGLLLGFGLWLAFTGFQAMTNKALAEPERRKGLWRMNMGILFAAVSMFGMTVLPGV